jgi:Family of unknown function (DUF6445)
MTIHFNPHPHARVVEFEHDVFAIVVEDALVDPSAWRKWALDNHAAFAASSSNAYPGRLLPAPASLSDALDDYFAQHVRRVLGGRRTLRSLSRFAIVDRPPATLEARQTICHRDTAWVDPAQLNAACMLYLFEDANLGGTDFYRPVAPPEVIARLVHDSGVMNAEEFSARYGLARDYMTATNAFFERIGTIPARWNRLVFYDGNVFHSGSISRKAWQKSSLAEGRLTLNGFFTCSRQSAM